MHVALVGGEDVHRNGTEERIAGFLEDHRLADMAQAQAAVFDADMRSQQVPLRAPSATSSRRNSSVGTVMGLPRIALQRDDLVADEGRVCAAAVPAIQG